MDINILVVEDDTAKYGNIWKALTDCGVSKSNINRASYASEAYVLIEKIRYDLVILDINIPLREGDARAKRGGGLNVLSEIERDENLHRPRFIVGLTAYEDALEEFGPTFSDELWSIMHYSEKSDRWISQLKQKVSYLKAFKDSDMFSDGTTFGVDVAIVTALDKVEFSAVKNLNCGWSQLKLPHDDTRYLSGTLAGGGRNLTVIAATAPRMGMPASSALASKIIHQFRPKYMIMTGICAGRTGKVNLGDIIIADPTWDWGSGKVVSEGNVPKFLPSPHQLDLDPDIVAVLKEMAADQTLLDEIKRRVMSKPQPDRTLGAHIGPMASGAAVVAYGPTVQQIADQNRNVLAVEMEAYAVSAAALGNGRPRPIPIIIKGVCDYADEDKNDDYQDYAAAVSAEFAFEVIKRLP